MTFIEDDREPTTAELLRAYTCDGCGRYKSPAAMLQQPCPTGDCNQLICPDCGHEWASWGPVLCRSCGDMSWFWRQHHRITMWFFNKVEMPVRAWLRKRKGKR